MRKLPYGNTTWRRQLHSTVSHKLPLKQVESVQGPVNTIAFQQRALIPQKPLLIQKDALSSITSLPAVGKWFLTESSTDNGTAPDVGPCFTPYMDEFQEWPFPYELVKPAGGDLCAVSRFRDWLLASQDMRDQIMAGILQPALTESLGGQQFFQLYAPLNLLTKALQFNRLRNVDSARPLELYIAQSSLTDLPPALQKDVPAPELVRKAGKGDIYSSSVWLGTEPTYTPLHRDPNPNMFSQLCSGKVVRLLPPSFGEQLFLRVQMQIRQQGNSRIRTTDMMEGKERAALHDAVWQDDNATNEIHEAELKSGDSLFIPHGWWHSVKSKGSMGHLNGSVNWWFR